MKRLLTVLCLGLSFATPSLGQDATYEPEDAKRLEECLDSVKFAASGEGEDPDANIPSLTDCIGAASGACMDLPGNYKTIGMSECMGRETAWWDELLNAHYATLRETLDEESATALRDTQRAWIAFRDAECSFQYTYWRDGTIRSTFYSSCMLDETARRAIVLESVLDWAL